MDNLILIFFAFLNTTGLILYAWLILILVDVLVCKDAKEINTKKLFSRALVVRLRLLKRSLGDNFYRGSLILLVGSCLVVVLRLSDMSAGIVQNPSIRSFASVFIPLGLIMIYTYLGHKTSLQK